MAGGPPGTCLRLPVRCTQTGAVTHRQVWGPHKTRYRTLQRRVNPPEAGKPSRGGQARGPGSGSPQAEPGAPTSSPFDFATLRSGRPLEDFPSVGTPSRARAHGQRPWPESKGRNNRSRAQLRAALSLSGVGPACAVHADRPGLYPPEVWRGELP